MQLTIHHAIHHAIDTTRPVCSIYRYGASITWHTKGCCNCGVGDIIVCWSNATAAEDHAIWSDTILQSQDSLHNVVCVIRNVLCPHKVNSLPLHNDNSVYSRAR